MSASIFLAKAMAMESASAFSGFGDTTVGEVTVFHHLFGYGIDVLKSPQLQRPGNQHHACTVNGSIDNLHVLLTAYRLRVDGNGFYFIQIKFVYLFTDNLNQRIGRVQYRMQTFNILGTDFVHLVDDTLVVGSQYLGTVVPVSLVTVVFFRIVGSRRMIPLWQPN